VKKKILLVDDSVASLMTALLALKRAYDVVTARDGEEGVEKALSERPDLILMDVVLPRLDGFSAVKRLRSREATRAVPIIMLTSRGEGEHVGLASGASDSITKPFEARELLAKVRSYLGR
jgi:DNA-binding response OmpR family regulator